MFKNKRGNEELKNGIKCANFAIGAIMGNHWGSRDNYQTKVSEHLRTQWSNGFSSESNTCSDQAFSWKSRRFLVHGVVMRRWL